MNARTNERMNERTNDCVKFVHVAIQRNVERNAESQEYFGKRSIIHGPTGRRLSWMAVILEQLEDALGAAVTLSKLLAANEGLMRRYTDRSTY